MMFFGFLFVKVSQVIVFVCLMKFQQVIVSDCLKVFDKT